MVIHGIGTMTYGQRDFWPDGSFITTQWIVIAWVPIAPLYSMRLTRSNEGKPLARRNSEGYYIYEETGPNPRQVVSVYCWLASVIGIFVAFRKGQNYLDRLLGDMGGALMLLVLGAVAACPWLIRRWTKRRLTKEWLRQAAGLGPSKF